MPDSKTIEDVAQDLATAHKGEDPHTQAIYLSRSTAEVRLVEVTGSVGDAGEVLPFRFGARPDLGVTYPSVVVLLSPGEWDEVRKGTLSLPEGWDPPEALKKIA